MGKLPHIMKQKDMREFFYVIDCIALTVVVLMQEGKQQGLGAIAGISDTYWGRNKSRSAEVTLIRATKIMAVLFIVLSVVLNMNF